MPKRTGRPWQRVKAQVIRRDGGICHLCGRPGADTADHLTPTTHGGALYDPTNLAAAHHDVWPHCNRVRGDRPIDTARTAIATIIANREGVTSGWDW